MDSYQIYVSEIACAICSKTNENQSIFRFVCMDALQNWWKIVLLLVSNTKVRKFLSFQGISWSVKNTKGQTYSEPDVGMRFNAKISNEWAKTTC